MVLALAYILLSFWPLHMPGGGIVLPDTRGKTNHICNVPAGTITLYRVGSGITHEQLRQLFSKFGEVKNVRECPDQPGNCLVEFFDTRHAAAAYQAIERPGQASALQPQPQAGLQPRPSGMFSPLLCIVMFGMP